jgi:hypothetical protein
MSDQGYRDLYDDLRAGQMRDRAEAATDDTPLFAPHTRARLTNPGTSLHAAEQANVKDQQRFVLLALEAAGPMTADEIDQYLLWRPTTAGRRMGELARLGLIRTTGEERRTRSGRMAEVWERVEARAA